MQGHLVKLLYVALFSYSFLFMISPQRQFLIKVSRIIDGDSIIDSYGNRMRLAFIDAPEIKQYSIDKVPIGVQSKDFLVKLLKGKQVRVSILGKDYFGRNLAVLYVDKININKLMVKSGYAVSYKTRYLFYEHIAKKKKRGMWKTSGFYYPKVFRKFKK